MRNMILALLFGLTFTAQAGYEYGTSDQVLRVPHAGGRPLYGQIDLSQSAAVTGALPIANGGSGQTSATNAFNALAPATAKGGVILGTGTNTYANTAVGADGTILTADSSQSGGASFQTFSPSGLAQGLSNIGLKTSVATNALTISLTQNDGTTNCSAGAPCKIVFRTATATTGGYTSVSVTGALSLVVPASATLGQTSAANQYVWVYAINNAGTVDLCVTGIAPADDTSLQSGTAISSSSTSGSTIYCGGGYSTKAIRLIGRLLVNETTAGTWASAPTEVAVGALPKYNVTEWTAGGTLTVTATTSNPVKGTTSVDRVMYRRLGAVLEVTYAYAQSGTGTSGSGDYLFLIPNSYVIDTTSITVYTTVVGNATQSKQTNTVGAGWVSGSSDSGAAVASVYDTTHVRFFMVMTADSGAICATSNTGTGATNVTWNMRILVPVVGWSSFGP